MRTIRRAGSEARSAVGPHFDVTATHREARLGRLPWRELSDVSEELATPKAREK